MLNRVKLNDRTITFNNREIKVPLLVELANVAIQEYEKLTGQCPVKLVDDEGDNG